MKLLEIWKRIGKQPLRIIRKRDAIVFIGDSEYRIKNIKYDHGKFIGFEAEQIEWISEKIKPDEDKWVIVRDKNGKEYRDHQWIGHAWYSFVRDGIGCDGWRSEIDIVCWKYE